MRKIITLTFLVIMSMGTIYAQTDIAELQTTFNGFTDSMSSVLPLNAAVGLNWSDAYIGRLPHFGLGVTGGAAFIPSDEIRPLLSDMGYDLPSELDSLGVPLPAAMIEGRLGGFKLPFDLGFKVGFIPEEGQAAIASAAEDLSVDYLMFGADVRYAIVKGNLLLPTVSVGAGFTYLKGGISTPIGDTQNYEYNDGSTTHYVRITDPDLGLTWESKSIDLKLQVSKKILILTPYAGLGASYGFSSAGYNIDSDVLYSTDGSTYAPITASQKADLESALTAGGIDAPDFSATGISYTAPANGWAFRAFGGLSLDLLALRVDVTAMYDFLAETIAGSAGVRLQF